MIFNVPGHIDLIRSGQKTQTRRLNRGCYHEGKKYAVQSKRGVKAEIGIRIEMVGIWEENCKRRVDTRGNPLNPCISIYDAKEEGGYTPEDYELEFRRAYPNWDEMTRWVYSFLVVDVQR